MMRRSPRVNKGQNRYSLSPPVSMKQSFLKRSLNTIDYESQKWTLKEVTVFYSAFHRLSEGIFDLDPNTWLPNRTKDMILSFYRRYKQFLSLPEKTFLQVVEEGEMPEELPRSKRSKSSEFSPIRFLHAVARFTPQTQSIRDPSFKNALVCLKHLPAFMRFCRYEWFYSSIEYCYFIEHNDFANCLKALNLSFVTRLTRTEWNYVRSIMGKPRRMSPRFLEEERDKLAKYRDYVYEIQKTRKVPKLDDEELAVAFSSISIPDFIPVDTDVVFKVKNDIIAGTINQLHDEPDKYYVITQNSLTPYLIRNSKISPQNRIPLITESLSAPCSNDEDAYHSKDDLPTISRALIFLDRKEVLLRYINSVNVEASKLIAQNNDNPEGAFPLAFQQCYAYAVNQLEKTNRVLDSDLIKLRTTTTRKIPAPLPSDSPVIPSSYQLIQSVYAKATSIVNKNNSQRLGTPRRKNAISNNSGLEDENVKSLIVSCVALVILLQMCLQKGLIPGSSLTFDSIIDSMRPKSNESIASFQAIFDAISYIKSML